jgi:hypothetical protein
MRKHCTVLDASFCIILINFASNINIFSPVSGDKNRKRRKNEGEYAPAANQGALLLFMRRALPHPPLHASPRQTARYQYLLVQVVFVQYLCVVYSNKSTFQFGLMT